LRFKCLSGQQVLASSFDKPLIPIATSLGKTPLYLPHNTSFTLFTGELESLEMAEEENEPFRRQPVFYRELQWAPCSLGRACSFFMIPFVFGIIGITWIPFMRVFADGSLTGGFCLLVFHGLLMLLSLSYFQAIVGEMLPSS
jgi:hypothetical protein